MAKASESDINMAMTLANYCDAISRNYMPDDLSLDEEHIEWLDINDCDQYKRLIDGLQRLLDQGSISRVVFGMAVLCDSANELIDPNSDTIEHHPMRQLLEQQRDELLAALSELTSTVGLAIDGATGWDAHKNARKLLASLKGQSCP